VHNNKKRIIFPVRASFIESVKHRAWLLYTPPTEPDSIGHFNPITDVIRVLCEAKTGCGEYATIVQHVYHNIVVI
jgi:hypothetical protein